MFILICYESGRKTDYSKGLILINYDAVWDSDHLDLDLIWFVSDFCLRLLPKLAQNRTWLKKSQNLFKILKRPATMDPKRKEFYFFEWLNWIKLNGLIFTYQMPFNILLTSCVNVFFWEILLIILYSSRQDLFNLSCVIPRLEKCWFHWWYWSHQYVPNADNWPWPLWGPSSTIIHALQLEISLVLINFDNDHLWTISRNSQTKNLNCLHSRSQVL